MSYVNEEVEAKIGEKLFFPLIDGLNKEKMGFAGVLKADIIIDDKNNPNVVGIDVNFGDPETQTVLPLLNEDLFDVMMLTSAGALADSYDSFSYNNNYSVCVNLVSDGYPGEYKKGVAIEGLDEIDDDNTLVFHAGTKKNIYAEIITDGPKVIDVVSTASTLSRAHELVYEAANQIDYQNIKYRTDIAKNKVLLDIK